MAWLALLLAHLLILFLVIVVPIRGFQRYRVLMRRIARHPELRAKFYVQGMLAQWLMLIPLVVIIFGLGWSPHILGLQPPDNIFLALFFGIILVSAFYIQVFYISRASRTSEGRTQLRQSMSGPLHMLPRTSRERALWVLLSLTAGFCEELLYRGFMPEYLNRIFPGIPFVLALVVAAVLFGIGHVYQKLPGVLGTGLMGLVFGFLYFFTGSLFMPMLVHALFDLRLLFIDVPTIVDNTEETPGAVHVS
ncbi:MAG TPA: type II CAAX endopeptidase family protein [Ktedonobacteraceae bacterium]|nr:type II CAAX endopeptidase family protein [Ktedonobacteraceae bacterium]